MSLFTITVQHAERSFSTQLAAPDARFAVAYFLDRLYPSLRLDGFGASAPDLGASDLVMFTPMDGLTNVWAATAGRNGSYINLVCSLTVGDD